MDETRTLYENGPLTVEVMMETDDENPNFPDFENKEAEEEYRKRYEDTSFDFVIMTATVELAEMTIGSAAMGGIEHGQVSEDTTADAWDATPAQYEKPNAIIMGSPLNGVILEALGNALAWAAKYANQHVCDEIERAIRVFDPNAEDEKEGTEVPDTFPVRPLSPDDPAKLRATCGECGRSWDDAVVTSMTPAPAGRCPFEYFH